MLWASFMNMGHAGKSSSTQFGFQVFAVVWHRAVANLGSLNVDHLAHKSQDPEQTAIVTLEDIFGTPASTYL